MSNLLGIDKITITVSSAMIEDLRGRFPYEVVDHLNYYDNVQLLSILSKRIYKLL